MLLGAGSRACLKKALTSYKQNRDLRAWHKHTLVPEIPHSLIYYYYKIPGWQP